MSPAERHNVTECGRADGRPTPALVLQCSQDAIAPPEVGRYVTDNLPNAQLAMLNATGHCPNLSAPEETVAAMAPFVDAATLGR